VFRNFLHSFKHLKGLFLSRLQCFIFALLAITYMVSDTFSSSLDYSNHKPTDILILRATIGLLT